MSAGTPHKDYGWQTLARSVCAAVALGVSSSPASADLVGNIGGVYEGVSVVLTSPDLPSCRPWTNPVPLDITIASDGSVKGKWRRLGGTEYDLTGTVTVDSAGGSNTLRIHASDGFGDLINGVISGNEIQARYTTSGGYCGSSTLWRKKITPLPNNPVPH
jgi:hypothetical protein